MDNIKLACDAASAVVCALLEYSRTGLDIEKFSEYVSEHFPKEVALHIKTLVFNAIEEEN